MTERILITGSGAVCAAGKQPEDIFAAVRDGRSSISPITEWDVAAWPNKVAGVVTDFNAREMVEDRKLHKLIRRTDMFG
ncbi:MAG: beta-ketoacyl synthase N-terminal-like domain-containing protein, partial [Hyphomicrobiales bacterium]